MPDKHFFPGSGPIWLISSILFLLASCQAPREESLTAQQIVDKSIASHGGEAYEQIDMAFRFRDKNYRITREGDSYRYVRSFQMEGSQVVDVLENGIFSRSIDSSTVVLPDSMISKYANSVNSVCYFVLLPYPLNDPAVSKKLLGRASIKGINYYKLQISFSEEEGGDDFEDTYIYWFHPTNFHLDYLAYDYQTDGGGLRFREAYNPRLVQGIRIQDYINYKGDHHKHDLTKTDSLFQEDALEELSRIETLPLSR